MRKLTLEKNKILFCIVIVSIFLIAIGIILLLIFVDKKQNPVTREQTVEERTAELLKGKSRNLTQSDRDRIIKLLNSLNEDKKLPVDEQKVLNLLNQKE